MVRRRESRGLSRGASATEFIHRTVSSLTTTLRACLLTFLRPDPKPKIDLASLKLPPDLRVTTPSSGTALREPHVAVVVEAQDQGGGIAEVRCTKTASWWLQDLGEASAMQKQTFEVNLVIGENILKAVALSKDRVESNDDTVRVVWKRQNSRSPSSAYLWWGSTNMKIRSLIWTSPNRMLKPLHDFSIWGTDCLVQSTLSSFQCGCNKSQHRTCFKRDSERAQPEDVLLVYLAGHGVGLGNKFTSFRMRCEPRWTRKLLSASTEFQLPYWAMRFFA